MSYGVQTCSSVHGFLIAPMKAYTMVLKGFIGNGCLPLLDLHSHCYVCIFIDSPSFALKIPQSSIKQW